MRAAAALAIVLTSVMGQPARPASTWTCPVPPIESCFTHHGRLSSQNGIPQRLWLIGTKRVVRVDNELPPLLQPYLEMTSPRHSYIYGDFVICPVERDVPGHMRRVCVTGARRLVVENLQGTPPPFRLLSTWPAGRPREISSDRRLVDGAGRAPAGGGRYATFRPRHAERADDECGEGGAQRAVTDGSAADRRIVVAR